MEFVLGNIFVREMHFEKTNSSIEGHAHNFDHVTYVIRGSLLIEKLLVTKPSVGDAPAEYRVVNSVIKKASDGHNWVLIKADTIHRLTALEDNSMGHCIYSHRNPQGEVVVEWDGWKEGTL